MSSAIAAIVFDPGEDPDTPMRAFAAARRADGLRVRGLTQFHTDERGAECDPFVRDLDTGESVCVMQDLGAAAEGCRVDPVALTEAARLLDAALARGADVMLVNRFGRLETEQGGLIAEIGRIVSEGAPLVLAVPRRYHAAWRAFADGLDAQLAPDADALEAWWRALTTARRSARLPADPAAC
ncbi:MAG: DUF2478 domain-containing protein [Hyphomicrobiales bacterium]|nr:DUF2478 domain-containing protein [Hyphomicrobiales bacterium]